MRSSATLTPRLRLLHHRPLLLVAEAAPVRPPVCRLRCQAVFAPCAISSAVKLSPSTRMKQLAPVHFVGGFFEAIAPNAQRMRRKTERRGILGMPDAAEVHSFDMHAPERPKSNRFKVRAHAVAMTWRPPASLRLPVLRLPFPLFPAQFLQIFRTLAQILRAQQMAPPASTLPSKDRAGGNSPPP